MRAVLMTLLLALVALTGCERDAFYDRALTQTGPFVLAQHVAWILTDQPALVLVDARTLERTWIDLNEAPLAAHVAPDGRGLLLLGEDSVTWLRTEGGQLASPVTYPTGARFGAVDFAPDGRRAILHLGAHRSDEVLTNPNRIGVLDLEAPASEHNPALRTLRAYGAAPRGIQIGPRQEIAGAERQLAWVLVDRYLLVLDMAAPTAAEVEVHFTLEGEIRDVMPAEVVDAVLGGNYTAFVRAEQSDDIYSLTFPDSAPADVVPRPYLNELPAGLRPTTLVALDVADGPRVFTLHAGGRALHIIEPETGHLTTVELPSAAHKMLPFVAAREDGTDGQSALLWSPGQATVLFVDLDLVERRAGQALRILTLDGAVSRVLPIPGRRAAVAQLDGNRIALLNFDNRTAAPLNAGGFISSLEVSADGEAVLLGVEAANGFSLAVVDPTGAEIRTALVPAGRGTVLHVPQVGRVLVDHGGLTGHISAWTPGAETVTERTGLFLAEVLNR